MKISYTDGKDKDFIMMCARLDNALNELAGGLENRQEYVEHNQLDDIKDAAVVYVDGTPIACGAFKQLDEETAEIKRVFVESNYRGKGVSRQLMAFLEDAARKKGYKKLVLETGRRMHVAVGFYRSIGYTERENYGPYIGMEKSICFEKWL
ncbi:MAG: GNAT family N-acetyltransferase [Clostridia bacterium]|nr:GNAT family N-acetyltransferase [Clostridia bacterium]